MKIYKGVNGLPIILDCGIDISGAYAFKILYQKPSGTKGEWPAELEGSTKIKFVTSSTTSELDEAGQWFIQAYVEGAGYKLFGDIVGIIVYEPLKS